MSKINHTILTTIDITRGPVLASTSIYRRELMKRLGGRFDVTAPQIDETPLKSEAPVTLVKRLAREKALTIAAIDASRVVIGSDQIAVFGGRILGKPGNRTSNIEQLAAFSGHRVRFLTAATVAAKGGRSQWHHLDITDVWFRALPRTEIERYVDTEKAYHCAGGFKCEGLGISLFSRIDNNDPTALIGLPMIFIAQALRHYGLVYPIVAPEV